MSERIFPDQTQGAARQRTRRVLRIFRFWWVFWALGSPLSWAEILYDEEGIQLHGTARIVTRNAATCNVLEEKEHYERLKANDGQPLHVWRLDYSVHNRTGKTLSYLRASFDIKSNWPPCTNWSWKGQGAAQYPGHVFWDDHPFQSITALYGMAPDEVKEEELYLIVFHTDEPTFEGWRTHFTFAKAGQSDRRPGVPVNRPVSSPGSPGGSTDGQLPPEMRLDEYLMEAEMLSEEKDHKGALEALDRIVALQKEHDLKLPEDFAFRYAQTALAAGSYQAAIDSANGYLSVVGREGKHYREALAVRVKSRRALRAAVAPDAIDETDALRGRTTTGGADQGVSRVPSPARKRLPYEPEMVVIPGGSFRMGCVSGIGCRDEFPVHEVRVETFELGKYEVTFEEYDRFTEATGRARADDQDRYRRQGWGRGRRAVTMVTWEDAVAYTRWLSRQTGLRYRLPSEAEWEYAARAGTETVYSWGNEFDCNRAEEFDCGRWASHRELVGLFAPNGWGLHDMHGNVSEWVQDCWNDSYQGAPADGAAWESGDCTYRMTRSGSGVNYSSMHSSSRDIWTSEDPASSLGFRVARTITP